ncbi:MAG: hydroxymethylbilane synthase [Candidatus Omnitrophica bacterium]|nr:hydroxymethylbilane synthase [Candidatus Omnitrophota bacterium]
MVSSDSLITIGTRASRLALAQAKIAVDSLQKQWPKLQFQIETISSIGDLDPEADFKELSDKQGKGIFTKALDDALLDRKIDVAIHSLKDLPIEMTDGLSIEAVLEREDPRDCWISKDKVSFDQARQGAVVGTSSVRRAAQLKYQRPDLQIVPLRGNVDTRIRKLREGNGKESLDAVVMALAGVRRAGLEKEVTEIFSHRQMLPAVGQGAIALVIRMNDESTQGIIREVDHPESHSEVEVERALLEKLGGGCHVPIAGAAQLDQQGAVVTLEGGVFSPDGKHSLRAKLTAPKVEGKPMAARLAQMLLWQGGNKLLG